MNNKASNIACRAELGRFPFKICIDRLVLKYVNHLINLPDDSLAKQSLLTSEFLYKRNKSCYITNFYKLLSFYVPSHSISHERPLSNSVINELFVAMKSKYTSTWKIHLQNSPKLSFYQTFKNNYEEEKYLSIIRNYDQRRQFTKLRISNHALSIETGRYSKPKTPPDKRLCLLCDKNAVETELHMICDCPAYDKIRSDFYLKIKSDILSNRNNIPALMNFKDEDQLFYFSIFIFKSFQLRKEKLAK